MAEETFSPAYAVPFAVVTANGLSALLGFAFCISLLYSIQARAAYALVHLQYRLSCWPHAATQCDTLQFRYRGGGSATYCKLGVRCKLNKASGSQQCTHGSRARLPCGEHHRAGF